MTLHPLDGVHFRGCLEHFHLTDKHLSVSHPQLITCSYIHACGTDDKCFQTTLFHLYFINSQ